MQGTYVRKKFICLFMRYLIGLFLFILAFGLNAQINTGSFATKVDFSTGSGTQLSSGIAVADFDGDGKTDIATSNAQNNVVAVFKNQAVNGIINAGSLSPLVTFSVGQTPLYLTSGDIDGDGKMDLASGNYGGNNISILRNTSTVGTINFATAVNYTVGPNSGQIVFEDFDGDGKKDIVNTNFGANTISVHRNLSTSGSVSLATRQDFSASNGLATAAKELSIDDIDGDGKKDIIVLYYNGYVGIFRNTSTLGSIAFAAAFHLTGINLNAGISSGDIDMDGKPDIAVSSNNTGVELVYRNTSSSGVVSFSPFISLNIGTGTSPHLNKIMDIDADNKPEIIVCNRAANTISIFRNFSTPGTIGVNSFSPAINFVSGNSPLGLDFADIDGDGKQEMICTNYAGNSISVLKNQIVPSTSGLVAYYPFNGNTGDSSGFGNHCTVFGGVNLTTGRTGAPNSAYYFDGVDDYMQVTQNISIEPTNAIAITAWISPEYLSNGGYRTLISKRYATSTDPYNSFSIQTHSISPINNRWQFSLSNGTNGSQRTLQARNAYPAQQWIFLAATLNQGMMNLYINGVLDTTMSFSGNIGYSTMNLLIGYSTAGVNEFYKGAIDELRIYNRALSAAEVYQLYSPQTTFYNKSTGALNVLSTWGANTDGSGTSPLSFDSANVKYVVTNSSTPSLSGSWMVNGAGSTVVFGDGTASFNLLIPSANTITVDSIYIRNNITLSVQGGLSCNKIGSESGSTVQYIGSSPQIIGAGQYHNMVITASQKTLAGNTSVYGTLNLTQNILCNSYTLSLGSSISQTGTLNRTSGTIIGSFKRWFGASVNSGSSGLFPVGTSSAYRPVQIDYTSAPTTGGTLTAGFVSANPGGTGLPLFDFPVFIDKTGINGYWSLLAANGLNGGTHTITATATGFDGVNSYTDLRLLRRNNATPTWTLSGTHSTTTGSNSAPVLSRSGLTVNGGEFCVAGDMSVNPLPVTWLSFDATRTGKNEITLLWTTAAEFNNDKYIMERSLDQKQFFPIGEVAAAGTTVLRNSYHYIDQLPEDLERSGKVFYRLKQVDVDGSFSYSETRVLDLGTIKLAIVFYPNPCSDQLHVSGLTEPVIVTDITGKTMFRILSDGSYDMSLLKSGLYFVTGKETTCKFIKE